MVITLTTDLGTRDHYAASLKGSLLTMQPGAVVVDITHEIAHFNLLEAAFVAKSACFKFPKGSVHIIGIDPEGGSRIGVVAMAQDGHFFVAPDNGVLSLIREGGDAECVLVNVDHLPLPPHGRSFLAQNRLVPVAAAIASGADLASLGQSGEIKEYRWGEPSFTENSLRGVILHIDHFGNAITNVRKDPFLVTKGDKSFQIFIRNLRMQRIVNSYADVAKGEALALFQRQWPPGNRHSGGISSAIARSEGSRYDYHRILRMITRIVRMEFDSEKVEQFLALFNATKSQIRHFPGVQHLELHRDAQNSNVFYTYSHWDNAESLEAYRTSALFESVWSRTKILFAGRPQAFSLVQEMVVD